MSAVQFLNSTPVQYKRVHVELLKPKSYNLITTPKINQSHSLNHQIMTFLSRDIADTIQDLFDKKLISNTGLEYFKKRADGDVDYMEGVYRKRDKITSFSDDFFRVQNFFTDLTEKSLSEFQRREDPLLAEILNTIYAIRFINNNVAFVSWAVGKLPDENVQKVMIKKRNELETLFMERYSKVSNLKAFDFNRYQPLFEKLKKMTYADFNGISG